MGFKTGDFPPVDPATFKQMPYQERVKVLSRHWAEYGFGAPKMTPLVYVAKLLVLYIAIGVTLITLTSGMNPLNPSEWWDEPIFWQKAVVWTMLLEGIGIAGSWGPLAGHFKPMTGGVLYWARKGTVRLPPWPDKVPGTKGTARTPVDVGLYVGFLGGLLLAILLPGSSATDLDAAAGTPNEGLIEILPLAVAVVCLVALGFRDKVAFIAARSEQYLPVLVFFVLFDFVDMIVAAKILIVAVWCGAAISKIGRHFANVIPPMVSNTPWIPSKNLKKGYYRDFPEDLRPSKTAVRLAHIGGTTVEFGAPLLLLLTENYTLAIVAVVAMIGFHVFIISTFPLAVPLEWNALFGYAAAFLFLAFPNKDGFGLGDMNSTLLLLVVVTSVMFPILGNLRPDLVSFLPSMRQYAGNWASAMWMFAPGAEAKLDAGGITKPSTMQKDQLTDIYGEEAAEVVMQQLVGWRALHSQGRALNSLMMKTLGDDMNHYTPREAEFSCNSLVGFNFGDGHLHDHRMIEAIQERVGFEPGEFIIAWIESEPIGNGRQKYWICDAAVGVVERGSYAVADAVCEQPWLPNGPIKLDVDWQMEGYQRVRHASVDGVVAAAAANGAANGAVRPQGVPA